MAGVPVDNHLAAGGVAAGDGSEEREVRHARLPPFAMGAVGGGLVAAIVFAITAVWFQRPAGSTVAVPSVAAMPREAALEGQPRSGSRLYQRDAPGVVSISSTGTNVPQPASGYLRGEVGPQGPGIGSGFEIDRRGDILTNWHVVANSTAVTVSVDNAGRSINARIIGDDPSHDLALLRIAARGETLHPLVLGRSRGVQVGEPVFAIGSPFDYAGTLTNGIVSSLGRSIHTASGATISGVIQTDVPINPGNSGGPLLNLRGEVVGINSQIVSSSSTGGNVGIAFAIPIDTVASELTALERGGTSG